jgi:hypothetical protein
MSGVFPAVDGRRGEGANVADRSFAAMRHAAESGFNYFGRPPRIIPDSLKWFY